MSGVELLKLLSGTAMLREALLQLGLAVFVAVTVGGMLYFGAAALMAAPHAVSVAPDVSPSSCKKYPHSALFLVLGAVGTSYQRCFPLSACRPCAEHLRQAYADVPIWFFRARQLLEHVPQKGSVFCEKGCSNKQLERDDNF